MKRATVSNVISGDQFEGKSNGPNSRGSTRRPRFTDTLLRCTESRVSQVFGRRVLCKWRNAVLFLSQQCVGAARWYQHGPDARTQWGALNPSLHFLFGYVLFWLHQEAEGFEQVAEKDRVFRQVPNQPLQQTAATMLISESSLALAAAAAAELGR